MYLKPSRRIHLCGVRGLMPPLTLVPNLGNISSVTYLDNPFGISCSAISLAYFLAVSGAIVPAEYWARSAGVMLHLFERRYARIACATSGSESNEKTLLCAPLCDEGNSPVSSNILAHFRIDRPPWYWALPSDNAASPEASIRGLLPCIIKL